MKSELYSSFATSSSRHSPTCARKWRHRPPQAVRAGIGSRGFECAESSRVAGVTPRVPSPNPRSRTRGLAPKRPVVRTRIPQRPRRRQQRGHDPSKMSYGHYSMSSNVRAADSGTKLSCCEASWMIDIPALTRPRNHSRALYLRADVMNAATCKDCEWSGTRYLPELRSWRRWLAAARCPSGHRSAGWIRRWRRLPDHRLSPRQTPRSSRRFSLRVIPSNFSGSSLYPPFKIR